MAEQKDQSFLPKVDESDLAQILFEDITDPTHKERWQRLATTNPELAREILRRAYMYTQHVENPGETTKYIIDNVTFALSALEVALRRTATDKTAELQPPAA